MGVPITHHLDKHLLAEGINGFSSDDFNAFIMYLAKTKGLRVTEITNEFLLDYHKKLKIQSFSNRCEEEILAGFVSPTNGNTYRTNIDDQVNMLGKYMIVKDDTSISQVFWKAENIGEQIPHTREEFLSIVLEGFNHKEDRLYKLHTLRIQVRSCTTDEEILAISW